MNKLQQNQEHKLMMTYLYYFQLKNYMDSVFMLSAMRFSKFNFPNHKRSKFCPENWHVRIKTSKALGQYTNVIDMHPSSNKYFILEHTRTA